MKNKYAVALGKKGGKVGGLAKSESKTAAARSNGAKGGRPPLTNEIERLRSALYVIAYADAKPCEDCPIEIASKTLEDGADYSAFLPNSPLSPEAEKAMDDLLDCSAKVPFKPFPTISKYSHI